MAIGTVSSSGNIVGFNALAYTAWEANTMNNTAISFTNGTVGYSWLEGNMLNEVANANTLSSSSNVLYWFDAPPYGNTWLPANSGTAHTANVIIAFDTPTNNIWDGNFIGVAPQLTCSNPASPSTCSSGYGVNGIYGQYDNGANVFTTLYQSFIGTGTPTGWSKSLGSPAIDNGISVGGSQGVETISSAYGLNANQVLDFFANVPTSSGT